MKQPKHRVKFPCNHPLQSVCLDFPNDEVSSETSPRSGSHSCDGCGSSDGWGYYCQICNFGLHSYCMVVPDVINIPCHSRHPLKLVSTETIANTDGKCHFCRYELDDLTYHCSTCSFSLHVRCSVVPPPLTVYQPKSHNHTFTLMARLISFTCNACGIGGERNPYVCLECNFTLHKSCIDLPRVININRHEHRIYRTYDLNLGDWECGVCRKKIDGAFGAFSCKRCPDYVVHSKCATRKDVWDGKELEDEPEEDEVEDPYEVINDKEIKHFSHQHNLGLVDDDIADYEKMRCDACIRPMDSDPFFKCEECIFFLHKACASLPRLKRNILHNHKLSLQVMYENDRCMCTYCLQSFHGFRYICSSTELCESGPPPYFVIDVRCASIPEPFLHELHPHPLYRTTAEQKTCGACGEVSNYVLSCIVCEYALGMECAMLPRKVKHRCDDHVLSLHHDLENHNNGQLWCDICEGKTDPSVWFYGCDDCGVTLHIKCVIGDMYYLKPWDTLFDAIVLPNNGMCRPFCLVCDNRCMFPSLFVESRGPSLRYACSMECAHGTQWHKWIYGKIAPWHKNPPMSYFLKWR
ncbi:unnamed protein product [Microthlaspi erraticum]|uniref:Phorbol-ester/DAG-type domain-containing protein n=1 Tax=Microthlaspi erraticum TaxID=1685480 RepID=A0A6D2KDY9_9BRAS|nr:unnamed protein product [Microthlaspi erraticum]